MLATKKFISKGGRLQKVWAPRLIYSPLSIDKKKVNNLGISAVEKLDNLPGMQKKILSLIIKPFINQSFQRSPLENLYNKNIQFSKGLNVCFITLF